MKSAPMCFSVIDVTQPEEPKVITQIPVEADFVRCNSLGLAGNTLVVAHQTGKAGQPDAGMDIYDIADPAHRRNCRISTLRGRIRAACILSGSSMGTMPIFRPARADFAPHDPKLTTSS